MNFIGIIPARYQSSRFPGKPLCDILGKPMIWHVYNSITNWSMWSQVYVATDSPKIEKVCIQFDIPSVMTRSNHVDCLDRVAEAAFILETKGEVADRYIAIQGDEPLFDISTLNVDLSPSIVNFYTQVQDKRELYDANAVKVVISKNQKALYFSRYTLPYTEEKTKRTNEKPLFYKQIGVYSFSCEMLKVFSSLRPSYLEKMEGIGLNRLLENDISIDMRYTSCDSISVDTPEDRDRIIEIIRNKYKKAGCSIDDKGNVLDCNGYHVS